MNVRENCEKLVEVGGLKYIFPLLMGHSLWKTNNAIDKKTAQGWCVSIYLVHLVPSDVRDYTTCQFGSIATG